MSSRETTSFSNDLNLFVWHEERWRIQEITDCAPWAWGTRGACTDTGDPDMWFAPEGHLNRDYLSSICARCEVIDECLQHALIHNERGWWGGTSRADRNATLGRCAAG